jgi:putative ATPase
LLQVTDTSLFSRSAAPLAARMRPQTLEELLGQDHILGPGMALGDFVRRGDIGSCIFWGPPGSGKTTLAHLIARHTARHFEPFSAVTEGVARVREIIKDAEARLRLEGRGTILFCDEIHRFNRGQQDAFLPWVENGTVTLIGATTENPSFELTGALLSRCRVFVLAPLREEHVRTLVTRALSDEARGLGTLKLTIDEDALALLAREADGDARRALQALEAAAEHARPPGRLTVAVIADALQQRIAKSDKSGEEHYNLISALHKAVRGSDVEGSLYWLARMLAGGQDPLYVARRLVRIAVEDIGLADPRALSLALAAKDAYHFLGSPEGELALAEATIYLATAPKSNRVYEAFGRATQAAAEHPGEGVPLHLRNAPTPLMKELGYGAGYRYAHSHDNAFAPQDYLPDALRGATWYVPSEFGYEKTVKERMEWWRQLKQDASEGDRDTLPHG